MKALITGSTGFIGRKLTEVLLRKGYSVTCTVREFSDLSPLKNYNVTILKGNLLDNNFLEILPKEIDMVFHLASIRGEKPFPYSLYEKTNVKITKNLLKIYERSLFIYCSTVGVTGFGKGMDENSPLRGEGKYHKSKEEAEKLCKNHKNCIIIRPAITYGAGDRDGFLCKLINLIKNKRFLFVGTGKNKIHMVHIDNLAGGFLQIAEKGKSGETYIIADKTSLSLKEIVEIIEEKLETEVFPIYIPGIIVYTLALLYQNIYSFFFPGKDPFITTSKVDIISLDQDFDISKALSSGYEPERVTKKGIEEEIEWILKEKI